VCSVEGCGKPAKGRGLCSAHHTRWLRGQDIGARSRYEKTEEERFWEKVDTSGDCWEWQAQKDENGYGRFRNGLVSSYLAHRYAYVLHNGPIPDDIFVLHVCDNPTCIRPSHLFLGFHQENTEDMVAKGRAFSKLSAWDVIQIRWLRQQGKTYQALADMFGVRLTTVAHVIKRRTWKHITQEEVNLFGGI